MSIITDISEYKASDFDFEGYIATRTLLIKRKYKINKEDLKEYLK